MTEINSNIVKTTNNCIDSSYVHYNKPAETFTNNFLGEINSAVAHTPSFLSVTNKFDYSKLEGLVYSGETSKEIDKLVNEGVKIVELTSDKNREFSIDTLGDFKTKTIDFKKYTGTTKKIKEATNVNNILNSVQYSDKFDVAEQQTIVLGGINKLAKWLDESIANYEKQVEIGKNRGDSEVKLSFLLKLRAEIENCDFPIGFGSDEIFEKYTSEDSIIIGGYNKTISTGEYLNPDYSPEENNSVINHKDQSIIFNAAAFIQERKYQSEEELVAAIENGEFDDFKEALTNGGITKNEITRIYNDVINASNEVYNNFREVYFASNLAKELIKAAHITDEAVLLNVQEMIEDDFKNKLISPNWNTTTQNAVDSLVPGFILSDLTYSDVYIKTGDYSGIGFMDYLAYDKQSMTKDNVLQKGLEENLDNGSFYYYFNGNTTDYSKKILMNFVM